MPAATDSQTAILNLLFNNTAWTEVSDGIGATSTTGNLYVSLHTANPGDTTDPDQTTSEVATGVGAAYEDYVRGAVVRSSAGWAIQASAGGQTTVQNTAASDAPWATPWATAGAGSTGASITHFGIGTDASGAGQLLFFGALTTGTLSITAGDTPVTPAGALKVTVT